MLKVSKFVTITFVISILVLQLWLLFKLQLFGDEAFYWLEGQYLDWSYAELPGWSAWMIRLGVEIFGNHYFAVRLFSFLGFISSFYACYLFSKELNVPFNLNALLLSVPLFVLIATMALPDIWLLTLVMWLSYFFIIAVKYNKTKHWVILGIILALSLNVHVRMWIWLFFAGVVFTFLYYKDTKVIKSVLFITVPISLFGLLPILYFNINHDFALFSFQFGRRHPWVLQISNLNFMLSQLFVITPVVLLLWFKGVLQISKQPAAIKWVLLTSFSHAIFYCITTLFADGLRTTVHWLLISYIPVLVLAPYLLPKNKRLINLAMVSGGIVSLLLLLSLVFARQASSNIQARILDNSLGWHKLSQHVDKNLKKLKIDNLVADYFMTAAQLAFELNMPKSIKVLPHEKSIKHGRQKQLQIMGMLLEEPQHYTKKALLVVEDSTLKLKNKGKYYAQLCSYFSRMSYVETVNIEQSNKQFHLFIINHGNGCVIPPLFYVDIKDDKSIINISGWVVLHAIGIKSLWLVSQEETLIDDFRIINTGINQQFPEIEDPNLPNNAFKLAVDKSKINKNQFRIKAISNDDKVYFSPVYHLN